LPVLAPSGQWPGFFSNLYSCGVFESPFLGFSHRDPDPSLVAGPEVASPPTPSCF
jgi:hypothetical protein